MTPERQRKACRPGELLAGARSLIVVGASYADAEPEPEPPRDRPRGRIARYARGLDYHDVMKARLYTLAGHVRSLGDAGAGALGADDSTAVETRVFVDASPLVERAAAVRAGLGFVGKNTNLLTAGAGSWLLLGAILTTLDLATDPPTLRDCGSCRLCLDACPTGALPAPYVLDANRCISYLTIEHRGALPRDLRPMMGDHVFGCDICQDVCPWNRRTRVVPWPELVGDAAAARPPLGDLLALDDAEFRGRYRGTPITRAKRRGLLRNAAVALGNGGSEDDVEILARSLGDAEPLVRAHAAWSLGRIGGQEAQDALTEALRQESDATVRAELEAAFKDCVGLPATEDAETPGREWPAKLCDVDKT